MKLLTKVNGIIIQTWHFTEIVKDSEPTKRKRCRRSFKLITNQQEIEHLSGKRGCPTSLTFPGNDDRAFLLNGQSRFN